ncbi:MAG: ATP-binding cassette domain-containing protein, partial [Proteobacteria bacterium]|nr:ATP-binding cassette domain-containing protein [Pseudomonadota bacterium]
MTTAAVRLSSVRKRFGKTEAVRGMDLVVPEGSLTGFIGPNGAGKSTTIRMIMSIIHPDEGSVEVLGSDAIAAKDRIGYLPEERGLYRRMRVTEFLKYMATLKGVPSAGLGARVHAWLERVQLAEAARKRCQELSKGQQQKIQFIASVIHDPDLIILDEPFSGLDPVNARLLNRLIRDLHAQGRTIIFSTHVMHQAEQLCDRIILINRGEKILDASMPEIHRRFDPRTVLVEPSSHDPAEAARLAGLPGVQRAQWIADR